MKYLILCSALLFGISLTSHAQEKAQRPSAKDAGKFYSKKGNRMLYGGDGNDFDISNCELKEEQYHYGIGREKFPALLEPQFESIEEADKTWKDEDRFLVAHDGDEVKAYSVYDLTRHEVVNDELNGKPIMAAYCILADLGAVYTRQYGDDVLTFALSGYTYYDPKVWDGMDGFILWDRDTESLWWPLVGKAVSGDLKDVPLVELDQAMWEDTTWKTIKEKYPNAEVLISGQDYERPESWPQLEDPEEIVRLFKK